MFIEHDPKLPEQFVRLSINLLFLVGKHEKLVCNCALHIKTSKHALNQGLEINQFCKQYNINYWWYRIRKTECAPRYRCLHVSMILMCYY